MKVNYAVITLFVYANISLHLIVFKCVLNKNKYIVLLYLVIQTRIEFIIYLFNELYEK